MKLISWLILFGLIYIIYTIQPPETKLKIDTTLSNIKNSIWKPGNTTITSQDTNTLPTTTYQPVQNGERTILGPVYQEVQCVADLECQEWYKCQDCFCDKEQGVCYYS